jgi:hypothetical protein
MKIMTNIKAHPAVYCFSLFLLVSQAHGETAVYCSNDDMDYGFLSLYIVPHTTIVTGTFSDQKRHKGRLLESTLSRPPQADDLENPDFSMRIQMIFDTPRLGINGVHLTIKRQEDEQGHTVFWQTGRGYEIQSGKQKEVIDFISHKVDCELFLD